MCLCRGRLFFLLSRLAVRSSLTLARAHAPIPTGGQGCVTEERNHPPSIPRLRDPGSSRGKASIPDASRFSPIPTETLASSPDVAPAARAVKAHRAPSRGGSTRSLDEHQVALDSQTEVHPTSALSLQFPLRNTSRMQFPKLKYYVSAVWGMVNCNSFGTGKIDVGPGLLEAIEVRSNAGLLSKSTLQSYPTVQGCKQVAHCKIARITTNL